MVQSLLSNPAVRHDTAHLDGTSFFARPHADLSYGTLSLGSERTLAATLKNLHIMPDSVVIIQIPAGFNRTQNTEAAVRLAAAIKNHQPECSVTLAVRIDDTELDRFGFSRDEGHQFSGFREVSAAAERLGLQNVEIRPVVQKMCNSELEARDALTPGQNGLPGYTHLILPTHHPFLGRRLVEGLRSEAADHPGLEGRVIAVLHHPHPCSPKVAITEGISWIAEIGVRALLGDQAWSDVLHRRGVPGTLYTWAQRVKLALLGDGKPDALVDAEAPHDAQVAAAATDYTFQRPPAGSLVEQRPPQQA
jgi:hypothetical protein